MADNRIYDGVEAAIIPAFVVGLLSVPGFFFGGIEFAGNTLALDSTLALGGITVMYGTILAIVSYAFAGVVHEAWGDLTSASTGDVERLVVGGELGVLALVPLVGTLTDIVTTTTWGGVLYVVGGIVAIYFVAFSR